MPSHPCSSLLAGSLGASRRPSPAREARGRTSRYDAAPMLRISWPLAILLAAVIAIVARRPRLLEWVLVVFAIWFVVQALRDRRRRR